MITRFTAGGVLAALLTSAATGPSHGQTVRTTSGPSSLAGGAAGAGGGGAGGGVLTGACCAEGSCFVATNAAECFAFGGNFAGPDTDCDTFNWPFGGDCEGACCLDDGTCASLIDAFNCEMNLGGDFQGSFSNCEPALCEAPALEYNWSCLEGGILFDDACWMEGMAPGAFDTAIFDLGGVYDVSVEDGGAIDRAFVRSGLVTLDTGAGLFSIIGVTDPFVPSLVIADHTPSSAALTLTGEHFVTDTVHVATAPSTFGSLDVTGAGTSWFGTGTIELGRVGIGMMSVTSGAGVIADRWILAVAGSATAQAEVSGADSTVAVDDVMTVGKEGFALLDIEDGAVVESGDAIIGQQLSAYASVEVRGPGTAWMIHGTLDIALSGQAELVIADGASVSNDAFAIIGTFSTWLGTGDPPTYQPAVGVVSVDGPDSLFDVGGDLYVGLTGQATLLVSRGGRVLVGGDLLLGAQPNGVFFQTRVEISVSSADEYATNPVFEVGGLTDDFDVTLELADGYVPANGDTIHIVSAALGPGVFTLDLPPLDPPLEWVIDETTTDLTVTAAEPLPPRPVPGDANGDGLVNVDDIVAVVLALGPCPDPPDPCPEDVDGSGTVDVDDIVFVVLNFD